MNNESLLEIPKGAEILCADTQENTLCLWALVDPEAETEIRTFQIFGTGHPIDCDMGIERNYIGTAQKMGGSLIWHVFERLN